MGKSLTETAKSILMKEGMIPSVSPMDAGHPDRGAKQMTPNMATLRPGSRGTEGRFANPGSMPPGGMESAQDLGPALVNNTDIPPSAKAAGKVGKDKSRSGVSAVGPEPKKTQGQGPMAEEMEEDDDDKKKKIEEMYRDIKKAQKRKAREEEALDEEQLNEISSGKARAAAAAAADRLQASKDAGGTLTGREKRKLEAQLAKFAGYATRKASKERGEENINSAHTALDEEIEISEELEAFIDAMLEEGYSEEQIAEAIEENFELVSEEAEEEEESAKPSKMMKKSRKHNKAEEEGEEEGKEESSKTMKEHVDALLAGEHLSEEFRVKAETIFESAVNTRLQEELAVIEEAYAESLEQEVSSIMEQLTEQVDSYLNYVVEQWISENEIAIESGLRSELTEDFMNGLRNLFAEHYIDVPEEQVSIVEGLAEKVDSLEGKLNEEIERNVSLNKMLAESRKYEVLGEATVGLTSTQAEKLKALAENIDFTTTDEFARKVYTLKESYFPVNVNSQSTLDNVDIADGRSLIAEDYQGPMGAYVRALGKTQLK